MTSTNLVKFGVLPALAMGLAIATPAVAQSVSATQPAEISRVVVFGDSLSDGGYYLTILPLPAGSGKFTTNPDPVAVEVMATNLGLPLLPVYGKGGTNYAVGGARATLPNGLSIPITTQVTNFLASGSFRAGDLVYIQGGANDFFAYANGGFANPSILTTAAADMVGQVSRLANAGASRLVVLNIQSGGNPFIQSFNRSFESGLAQTKVNALFFNTDKLFNEILTNPSLYGFTNVTSPACTGSSLSCTRSTLVSPNAATTYALADDVHPAGVTQRIQGQAMTSVINAPEQLAGLNQSAQSAFRAQRALAEPASRGIAAKDGKQTALFGAISYHDFSNGSSVQRIGASENGFTANLGFDAAIGEKSGAGASLAYGESDGDFSSNGNYKVSYFSFTGYGRAAVGPVNLVADASFGKSDYSEINRVYTLGPATRVMTGDTNGNYAAVRLSAQADVFKLGSVAIGPDVALQYERTEVNGYSEKGTRSTDISIDDQEIKSFTGRAGLALHTEPGNGIGLFARAGYEREFENDPQRVTIRTSDAPISYTSTVSSADRSYMSYAVSANGSLSDRVSVRAGVSGEAFRKDRDDITAFAGLSLAF